MLRQLGLIVLLSGCATRTFSASVTQPHPLTSSRESWELHFDLKDMDLPRNMYMRQRASFSVVSRDRIRFHVQIVHKWEEYADITTWNVRLEDDLGNIYRPESKEKTKNKFTTRMWEEEQRTAVRNEFGDIVRLNNDGWKRPLPMQSADLFVGKGDYVFYSRDIMHRGIRRLTLIMARGGVEYRFTWNFVLPGDDPDDITRVAE
jgi:hypothetical protein